MQKAFLFRFLFSLDFSEQFLSEFFFQKCILFLPFLFPIDFFDGFNGLQEEVFGEVFSFWFFGHLNFKEICFLKKNFGIFRKELLFKKTDLLFSLQEPFLWYLENWPQKEFKEEEELDFSVFLRDKDFFQRIESSHDFFGEGDGEEEEELFQERLVFF